MQDYQINPPFTEMEEITLFQSRKLFEVAINQAEQNNEDVITVEIPEYNQNIFKTIIPKINKKIPVTTNRKEQSTNIFVFDLFLIKRILNQLYKKFSSRDSKNTPLDSGYQDQEFIFTVSSRDTVEVKVKKKSL